MNISGIFHKTHFKSQANTDLPKSRFAVYSIFPMSAPDVSALLGQKLLEVWNDQSSLSIGMDHARASVRYLQCSLDEKSAGWRDLRFL